MNMPQDLLQGCWEVLMTSRSCALGMGILVIIFELSLVASLQRSEVFFLNFHRLAFQFS